MNRFSALNYPPKNWTFACAVDTFGAVKVRVLKPAKLPTAAHMDLFVALM